MSKLSYEEKIDIYYKKWTVKKINCQRILKTEMIYDQEDNYIYYYIIIELKKLKGLSPVNYRLQSSN